jgi:aminopeptidase N
METVSGMDLKVFFDQWIFVAGHPKLSITWKYEQKQNRIKLTVNQNQEPPANFPLEIGIQDANGSMSIEKLHISVRKQDFMIPATNKPAGLTLDPNTWLLYEGSMKESAK